LNNSLNPTFLPRKSELYCIEKVAETWDDTDPDDVSSYTDIDLTYARGWSTRLYDPTGEYRSKATAIKDYYKLSDLSATVDFATRIGIASLIDNNEVLFSRGDFDVSYTIPPRGWVQTNVCGEITYSEVPTDSEYIQTSIPDVCKEMAEQMVEDGSIEKKRELITHGIDLLVGEDSI